MKRRLIIMRHAKSDWGTDARSDHDRPLNGRGRRDAPAVAERLAELDWTPQAVWSSDSRRTRETFERMALDEDTPVRFLRDLYHSDLDDIVACSAEWDDSLRTVMVLGHNPGWEDATSELSGVAVSMTTANAALLEGEGPTWIEALAGRWRLIKLIQPRDL